MILPGNSKGYSSGTYDKVTQGVTFIRTDKGEIDIHPNQVGLAENMGALPSLLKSVPDFYMIDPAKRGRNEISGHEKAGVGAADNNIEGHRPEQAGKESGSDHRAETGSSTRESRDNYLDLQAPGTAAPIGMPSGTESPATQQLPESSGQSGHEDHSHDN